ncbi:cobalt/nickel transport protein [Actinomadura pelletieri DSM 43383]|uniref:Cobalt/nickel transport protein n=1 Tax=Actinomadura pelletieri DSM 43383 TaxID=1120940 RepID=A0A495QUW1_9ACTN|nr:PDGLE domain-containing protein [Actinomadura pelletieri]RKS77227.1 cobalt/nickel transport protein [Actinomadura pelletieri DSM 43383]
MTTKRFFIGFLLVSLVLAGIVSYYASADPDGLEKVAEDKGINAEEKDHGLKDSPLGDYGVKGVDNARLSGGLSGVIGVGVVLLAGGGLFWFVRRRGSSDAAPRREENVASGTSGTG